MPATSCRLPPSPWKSITAGQPAAGGEPAGSVSVHASFAPSEAVTVTSSAEASAGTASAAAAASTTTRLLTTGASVAAA
jgi:hypothetical protein